MNWRSLIVGVATFVFSAFAFAEGLHIVSDVDDTVKVTQVEIAPAAGFNGVFRNQGFVGMPELFQGMAKKSRLTFMSGSPKSLRFKLNYFLKSRRYPEHDLMLRDWFRETDQRAYKAARLEVLAQASVQPFILIGDDTEADPEIYQEFFEHHPTRVAAIYIRQIKARTLPGIQRPFFSALDIAGWELAEGRLNDDQFRAVALAILNPTEDTQLIPDYAACPKKRSSEMSEIDVPALRHLRLQVDLEIERRCAALD